MGQVLIRNLDDAVIADYKQAAARRGRSLESELREALTIQRPRHRPSNDELIAIAHRLWAETPNRFEMSDSTALIREDRDNR